MTKKVCPIEPLFENVLCKRVEIEEKRVGMIIVPQSAIEKPMEAVVVSVGESVKKLKAGDAILVGRYAGAELSFQNEKYLVIREDEVLGIING